MLTDNERVEKIKTKLKQRDAFFGIYLNDFYNKKVQCYTLCTEI